MKMTSEFCRLRPMVAAALMALTLSPLLAMAASPATGSPLDASDVLVVSDSSTASVAGVSMARDAAGDFVIAWVQQASAIPNPETIHVQLFNAAGAPQGSAFQVDALANDGSAFAAHPAVAMDVDGDFVVAWQSPGAAVSNTPTYDVHARLYSCKGIAQGGEFAVNTSPNFDQAYPRVAMDAAGDFVVTWQGQPDGPANIPGGETSSAPHHIYARRYSAAGAAQGGELQLSNATDIDQTSPSVAMDAAGDFALAWQSSAVPVPTGVAPVFDVLVQRFDAAGTARGGAFAVSTAPDTSRQFPQVAMAAAGAFVVAWDNLNTLVHPETDEIHARRYDAAGTAQGGEFQANTFANGQQKNPSVTMDAAGDFAVAWASSDQVAADSGSDIYAQRYDAAGAPVGGESLINTLTAGNQTSPAAAMDADGDMVVAWDSDVGGQASIYFRRFAGENAVHLKLGAAFAPATPSPGSSFSMTLAVSNTSTTTPTGSSSVDAALDVGMGITAAIALPRGAVYRSAQGSDWTCANPADASLACSYGASLAAGSAAPPLTVMFTAPSAPGNLSFNASVTSTLTPVNSESVATSVAVQAGSNGSGSGGSGSSSGGSRGPGSAGAGSSMGGKGAVDVLTLVFLGLPLFGRRSSTKSGRGLRAL